MEELKKDLETLFREAMKLAEDGEPGARELVDDMFRQLDAKIKELKHE
jgi:hypothetical protein